jgi:GntR family transcriptional regulator
MDTPPLPLTLCAASGDPFYVQITDQIAELIRAGRLSPGDRLPSVRELARDLLVSVITTQAAYAELGRRGLIESRRGAGTFVAATAAPAAADWADALARTELGEAVQRALRLGIGADRVRELFEAAIVGAEGGQDD